MDEHSELKGNIVLTIELAIETLEKIVKLIQEDNTQWRVAKDIGYSQSALSKILCKYRSKKEKLRNFPGFPQNQSMAQGHFIVGAADELRLVHDRSKSNLTPSVFP